MDQQSSQSLVLAIVGVSALVGGYLHFAYTAIKDWPLPRACPTAHLEAQLQTVIGLFQTKQLASGEAVSLFPWKSLLVWNLVLVAAVVLVAKRFSREIVVGRPFGLAEIVDDDRNGGVVGAGVGKRRGAAGPKALPSGGIGNGTSWGK